MCRCDEIAIVSTMYVLFLALAYITLRLIKKNKRYLMSVSLNTQIINVACYKKFHCKKKKKKPGYIQPVPTITEMKHMKIC